MRPEFIRPFAPSGCFFFFYLREKETCSRTERTDPLCVRRGKQLELNHSAMANAAAQRERDAKLTGAFYIAAK